MYKKVKNSFLLVIVPCLLSSSLQASEETTNPTENFIAAARNGDSEELEALLESGVNVNATEHDSAKTALMLAVDGQHVGNIIILLKHEADTGTQENLHLLEAVYKNDTNTVQRLLVGGNITETDKNLALLLAAAVSDTEIVTLLIDNSANIETSDAKGSRPLMWAASRGKKETATKLIERRANVNETNTHGKTALLYAAQNGHTKTVEMLLTGRANINQANENNGYTALLCAAQNGDTKTVEMLLGNNATVDQANTNGDTALTLAAANGHVNIVKMFLKAESDSTTQGQSKNKAFTLALAHGYPEIVDLLQKGIPQEQADAALLEASQTGQRDMVKVLVENGANPYYENEEGENAFTVAPRDRIRSTILKSRNKTPLKIQKATAGLSIATALAPIAFSLQNKTHRNLTTELFKKSKRVFSLEEQKIIKRLKMVYGVSGATLLIALITAMVAQQTKDKAPAAI